MSRAPSRSFLITCADFQTQQWNRTWVAILSGDVLEVQRQRIFLPTDTPTATPKRTVPDVYSAVSGSYFHVGAAIQKAMHVIMRLLQHT